MLASRTASTLPWKSPRPVGSVMASEASSNRHSATCGTHWLPALLVLAGDERRRRQRERADRVDRQVRLEREQP